jgi:hypothetical protein
VLNRYGKKITKTKPFEGKDAIEKKHPELLASIAKLYHIKTLYSLSCKQ